MRRRTRLRRPSSPAKPRLEIEYADIARQKSCALQSPSMRTNTICLSRQTAHHASAVPLISSWTTLTDRALRGELEKCGRVPLLSSRISANAWPFAASTYARAGNPNLLSIRLPALFCLIIAAQPRREGRVERDRQSAGADPGKR